MFSAFDGPTAVFTFQSCMHISFSRSLDSFSFFCVSLSSSPSPMSSFAMNELRNVDDPIASTRAQKKNRSNIMNCVVYSIFSSALVAIFSAIRICHAANIGTREKNAAANTQESIERSKKKTLSRVFFNEMFRVYSSNTHTHTEHPSSVIYHYLFSEVRNLINMDCIFIFFNSWRSSVVVFSSLAMFIFSSLVRRHRCCCCCCSHPFMFHLIRNFIYLSVVRVCVYACWHFTNPMDVDAFFFVTVALILSRTPGAFIWCHSM